MIQSVREVNGREIQLGDYRSTAIVGCTVVTRVARKDLCQVQKFRELPERCCLLDNVRVKFLHAILLNAGLIVKIWAGLLKALLLSLSVKCGL